MTKTKEISPGPLSGYPGRDRTHAIMLAAVMKDAMLEKMVERQFSIDEARGSLASLLRLHFEIIKEDVLEAYIKRRAGSSPAPATNKE